MNQEIVERVMSDFVMSAATICGPILLSALVVGVVIGVLQAVTQVQEMTLTFVPKMIVIFVVLSMLGWWMVGELVNYMKMIFEIIPTLVN